METSAEDGMLKAVGADMEQENMISLSLHEKCGAVNSIDSLSDRTYLMDDSSDEDWGVAGVKPSGFCVSPSPLQCLECSKRFISSKRLIQHSKLHDGEATCNICQVIFSRAISLSIHLQNAHPLSLLSCPTCKLTFSNLWQLNKHIGIHRSKRVSTKSLDNNSKNDLNGFEGPQILPEQGEALLNKPDMVDIVKDHTYSRLIISEDKMKDHSYNRQYPSNSAAGNPAVNGKLKWELEESDDPEWDEEPGCFVSQHNTLSTGETDSSTTKVTGNHSLTSSTVDYSLFSGTEDCILNCSTGETIVISSISETETTVTTETVSETESCQTKSPTGRERGRRRRYCRVSDIVREVEEEEDDQDDYIKEEQDEDSSDSDFKPDDISNSDSESSSGSGSSTQSMRNQSAPDRVSGITDARLNQCVHCKEGPFLDMECHLERCTTMVHFQCTFCVAYFPTQEALMRHSVQSHQKRIPPSVKSVLPMNGTMSEHCYLQNQFRQTLVPTAPGMHSVLPPAPEQTPPQTLFLTLVQKPAMPPATPLTPVPALPLVQKPALTPVPALPLVQKQAVPLVQKPALTPVPAPALPLVQKPALSPVPALPLVQKPALTPVPALPLVQKQTVPLVQKPALTPVPAQPLVQKPAVPLVQKPAQPLVQKPAQPLVQRPALTIVQTPAQPLVQRPALTLVQKQAVPLVQKPAMTPVPAVPLVQKQVVPPDPSQPLVQKQVVPPVPAQPLVQKPAQPLVQKSSLTSVPAQPLVQKPAQPLVQKLSLTPVQKPAQPLIQKPAQPLVQKPALILVQKPALTLVQKPAQPLVQKPAQPLVQKPVLTPVPALPLVQKPAQTLVQKPALTIATAMPSALPLSLVQKTAMCPATPLTLVQKTAMPPTLVPAFTQVPAQKINNVGTPVLSSKCPYCGNGPFFSMEHHMQNCEKRISFQCFLCKALFSTNASIVEHLVKTHNAKVVSAGASSDILQNASNQASTLVCKSAVAVRTSSSSQPTTKPEPVSAMVSVVHSHPSGGQMTTGKKVLQSGPAPLLPTSTHVATPIQLSATQVAPPTHTVTTSTPGLHAVGNIIQGILQVRPFVRTNTQAPVLAPTSAAPFAPPSDPAAKTRKQHGFSGPAVAPATAKPSALGPTPLRIVTMFKNESRELALLERLKMSWRAKSVHRCRQCGAVSRQPSLIVRHRYLHRGPRPHRCHCGRAFRCRLHLLRHCIQHAEATSYICVACGETFAGAQVFARHMAGTSRKAGVKGGRRRSRPKCQVPFSCHCGKTFKRPSSYLWHTLQNRPMAKLT